MILKASRKSLFEKLSIAIRFTTSRSQLPVLGNILLDARDNKLYICATNLEMSVSMSIAAKVEEEGSITVPSKVIYEVVSNLSDDTISLSSEKEQLFIECGGFSSRISAMNSSDFPAIPGSISKESTKLTSSEISEFLPKVIYASSTDETRPTLTGVLMLMGTKSITLVATDGFRLSKVTIPSNASGSEHKIIFPKGVLSEISRVAKSGEISLEYKKDDKQVIFQMESLFLSSRVIEGDFPDYEKIIPKSKKIRVGVSREDLLQAVKLSSVFARDASNVTKFCVTGSELKLVSESSQSGNQQNSIAAKVDVEDKTIFGEKGEFVIAFNYKFVEDFLNSIEGESVDIEFNDENSPGVFLDPSDKNLLHLIMPVKV